MHTKLQPQPQTLLKDSKCSQMRERLPRAGIFSDYSYTKYSGGKTRTCCVANVTKQKFLRRFKYLSLGK